MVAIIIEGVLFVALIATAGTLFFVLLLRFTPLGVRIRQTQNRKRIERLADSSCAIHGPHEDNQLVRLASGERICPECFQEAVHGQLD